MEYILELPKHIIFAYLRTIRLRFFFVFRFVLGSYVMEIPKKKSPELNSKYINNTNQFQHYSTN